MRLFGYVERRNNDEIMVKEIGEIEIDVNRGKEYGLKLKSKEVMREDMRTRGIDEDIDIDRDG